MIGLVASVAVEGWPAIIAVALAFIAVGALIQYWACLELDDRRDARAQQVRVDEDQALRIGNGGSVPRIPTQRTSPEDGA